MTILPIQWWTSSRMNILKLLYIVFYILLKHLEGEASDPITHYHFLLFILLGINKQHFFSKYCKIQILHLSLYGLETFGFSQQQRFNLWGDKSREEKACFLQKKAKISWLPKKIVMGPPQG